ncbi:sex peptide receptor-like [Argopecten irradians]|uniref:sex peptide receptor-like n=1 Tax=Argopecten irradians TaxID=31199 RepID=UPI00372445B9
MADNISITAKQFCEETFQVTVNGFDWVSTCLKLALALAGQFGIASRRIVLTLKNLEFLKIVSEERGYDIQSRTDLENATNSFGFQVAYCARTYKWKKEDVISCSNILSKNEILHLGDVTEFCMENREDYSSDEICTDILLLASKVFNFTQFFELNEELFFYGYIYPFIVLLVLVSNAVLILTFLRGRFLSAAHLLLVAIAMMDTLTVAVPCPYLFYYLTLGNYVSYVPYHHCIAIIAILLIVSPICHGISIWLNFGLAIQRYVLLRHPSYTFSRFLRRKVCVIFMLLVVIAVTCVFIPGFFTLADYPIVYVYSANNEELKTILRYPVYAYAQLSIGQIYLSRCVIIQVIPCTGMFFLSVELVLRWKSAVKANHRMTTNEKGNGDAENTRTFNLVILNMLIVFLLAEIPTAFAAFLISWAALTNGTVKRPILVTAFVTNIIIAITPLVNLLVYVIHGDRFRQQLKQLILCRRGGQEFGDRARSRTSITEG